MSCPLDVLQNAKESDFHHSFWFYNLNNQKSSDAPLLCVGAGMKAVHLVLEPN